MDDLAANNDDDPDDERELKAFTEARMEEYWSGTGNPDTGFLNFTSRRALAAVWSDHPDYNPDWSI